MKKIGLSVLFFLVFSWNAGAETLIDRINTIAAETHSDIGVSAIYIERNQKVSYHGHQPYFMASTVKIPIALTLLHRVDQGQISLDQMVRLNSNAAIPGSGGLCKVLN